jgi:hypothetical protein
MMIRTALCAAFILALPVGAASALPASPTSGNAVQALGHDANIVEVKHNKRHWKRQWKKRHWRRHHSPPPGWHRYHRRPWDWQRRGCMAIGPVWFCP